MLQRRIITWITGSLFALFLIIPPVPAYASNSVRSVPVYVRRVGTNSFSVDLTDKTTRTHLGCFSPLFKNLSLYTGYVLNLNDTLTAQMYHGLACSGPNGPQTLSSVYQSLASTGQAADIVLY